MATPLPHVNKLAAAKRQLQASIRLFFMGEDRLAIHTVASAAYGLLKDLKRTFGQNEAADYYLTTIFYLVRDFRRGTLPTYLMSDAAMIAGIKHIADQLSPINKDSKLSDVKISIPDTLERQYWTENNQAANFLKHADRDSDGEFSLESINNYLLLLKCYSAYCDIGPDDLGNEGVVFKAFTLLSNSAYQTTNTVFGSLLESLKSVPDNKRLEYCYKLIVEMNAN